MEHGAGLPPDGRTGEPSLAFAGVARSFHGRIIPGEEKACAGCGSPVRAGLSNNALKLTRSASVTLPRPSQLNAVLGRP